MRTSNLVNTYINNSPALQQYNSDKAARDFDVRKELANRTFIKPLPANGKLVKNNLFSTPAEFFKDIKYDANAFKHSVKGEANDHELGRLNDIGMKLGGLAIACYLFARKAVPSEKLMEFIGFATFFASMDIWPKLALQLPARLLYGFNIRQKYEDNYGRKKMLFQDNQFIPWDLFSDEQINKIGNYLKVPKDIPNRRDFIQEKMRKIALQYNVLWMLTAGFATPIMSALISGGLLNSVQKYQDKVSNRKAEALLTNFSSEMSKYDYTAHDKTLKDFLTSIKGKPVTDDLIYQITQKLAQGVDNSLFPALEKDVRALYPSNNSYNITEATVKDLFSSIKKHFALDGLPEDVLLKILPEESVLLNAFKDKNLLAEGVPDVSQCALTVQNLVKQRIEEFKKSSSDARLNKKLDFYYYKFIHADNSVNNPSFYNVLKSDSANLITDASIDKILSVNKVLNKFKAQTAVLDKFAFLKAAHSRETVLANSWNLDMCKDLLKILGFTPADIKKSMYDTEIASSIMREKMENIACDEGRYNKFMTSLVEKLTVLYSKTDSLNYARNASEDSFLTQVFDNKNLYVDKTNTAYDTAADALKNLGMKESVRTLVGTDGRIQGSLKYLQLSFISDRITSVKSSFYRLFNAMDVYRRIADIAQNGSDILKEGVMLRQVKEELVELVKELLVSGHTSDYSVKFYCVRNPELNPARNLSKEQLKELYSQIEVAPDGKVINKYLGTVPETELVELPNDKEFFSNVMKFMYRERLHPNTSEKGQNSIFWNEFLKYRNDVLKMFGGESYFAKNYHLVDGVVYPSTSERRFLILGNSLDDLIHNLAKQSNNTRSWFKMFGGIGAGLLGVTLFIQLFFGKMRLPQDAKEAK